MPSQRRTLPENVSATPPPSSTNRPSNRPTARPTAAEVRQAVARFLTPSEVADLAAAALAHRPVGPSLTQFKRCFRGYAAAGVICTAEVTGLDVEILDETIPAGLRAAVIPWRQVARLVAAAATPSRLDALAVALAADDRPASRAAADAIVLGEPAVTQLDLLDVLAALAEQDGPGEQPAPAPRPKRARTTGSKTGAAR